MNAHQLQKYYKGKRVFITGHTGFKGSWLSEWLLMLGAEVKGYALNPETGFNHFSLLGLNDRMHSVIDDIRNKNKLEQEILSFKPDYIFHLAAQPLVRRSYRIPAETYAINVTGTANLLESIIKLENKCSIIVVTTDKVYENREEDVLYNETDQLGGFDPYSSSKACAELVVKSFRNAFFSTSNYSQHLKAIGAARAGNVIGGGDYCEDRLIPDIIRSLQQQQPLMLRYPNSIRPWQHVLEPLAGYLLWAGLLHEKGIDYSGAINFGPFPNDHLTVKEVVETAIATLGTGRWEQEHVTNEMHEAGILKLNIQKAQEMLQWLPKWNAKKAIEQTMHWYATEDKFKAEATRSQIEIYMQA